MSKNGLEEQEEQEGQNKGFKDPKAPITPILSQPLPDDPEDPAATVYLGPLGNCLLSVARKQDSPRKICGGCLVS